MTKTEAHYIIKSSLRGIRDKNLYEAIQIALRALSWECAHEKMLGITIIDDTKETTNEN